MGVFYDEIKADCDLLDISISELCREADIDRSLIARWKIEDPATLKTLAKINETLERLKNEKKEKKDD